MSIISKLAMTGFVLFFLVTPTSHASNFGLFQTSTYSTAPRFTGGGLVIGMGNGKMTFQTGGAYVTQTLAGTDSHHLIVPLWIRVRLAQALFIRFGGNVNYQTDQILPGQRALDFGALGGAGFDIPLGRTYGLVVAADYQYSILNGNNQVLGWVGLRFGRP